MNEKTDTLDWQIANSMHTAVLLVQEIADVNTASPGYGNIRSQPHSFFAIGILLLPRLSFQLLFFQWAMGTPAVDGIL